MGKNRIWYGLVGLVAMIFMLATTASALKKGYINGIDANFPPFAYVDETGKPAGFDVDAIDWIAEKLGFTVKHQPMDWDGIIPGLLEAVAERPTKSPSGSSPGAKSTRVLAVKSAPA